MRGEKLAARYLRRHGFKVLYRNFRGRQGGEIDLVCREGDTLVFVEVKTRTNKDFGRPIEAVNRQKQRRISLGGLAWLRLLGDPDILFRFDVVEVSDRGGKCSAPRANPECFPTLRALPLLKAELFL